MSGGCSIESVSTVVETEWCTYRVRIMHKQDTDGDIWTDGARVRKRGSGPFLVKKGVESSHVAQR